MTSAKGIDLSTIVLTAGYHETREEGMSVVEAAAYLAGERHSEQPHCVCPILVEVLGSWNDALPDDDIRTRLLMPLLPTIITSRATQEIQLRRSWMAIDWLLRAYAAAWLDLAGLAAHAAALRALAPIVGVESAEASEGVVRAARAAWDTGRDAVWDDARRVNKRATRDKSREVATYAARAVARYTGRTGVRNAARYAGWATAKFVSWDPADEGDWVAKTRELTSTVRALQASTLDLVQRMVAVKGGAL